MKSVFYFFILMSFVYAGCGGGDEETADPPANADAGDESASENQQEGNQTETEEGVMSLPTTETISLGENPAPPPAVLPGPIAGTQAVSPQEPPADGGTQNQPDPDAVEQQQPPAVLPAAGLQVVEFYEDFKKRRLIGLQQTLSNGQLALWVVENEGAWWDWRDFHAHAKKVKNTILKFMSHQDSLFSLVCADENETIEDKRADLIRYALPAGTLVVINPEDARVSTYMANYFSDSSSYKHYGINSVKLRNGIAVRINLVHTRDPNQQLLSAVVKTSDFDPGDFFDGVDLDQYIRVIESIKGRDGQFAVCSS